LNENTQTLRSGSYRSRISRNLDSLHDFINEPLKNDEVSDWNNTDGIQH